MSTLVTYFTLIVVGINRQQLLSLVEEVCFKILWFNNTDDKGTDYLQTLNKLRMY
jgi:hypothetical protein